MSVIVFITITNMVCSADTAGMQLSGSSRGQHQSLSAGEKLVTGKLTAWARVYLPLMIERYALEEGDQQTRYVRDRHHDSRNLHQPVSARHALSVHVQNVS